jgi:hypothetical protein
MPDNDFRADQPGLSEPAIPTEFRSPIVSAWDAGQRFNVLAFHLEQDWLLSGGQGQQGRVTTAFEVFAIAALEVLTSAADQDQLQGELEDWRSEWRSFIRSERHAERFIQAIGDIENEQPAGCADDVEAMCQDLGRTIDYEIDQLRKSFMERLDERQSQVFRLAELIDQLVRPRQIYREMFAAAEARSCFPDWRLRVVDETTQMPAQMKLAVIAQRWNRVGLPVDDLEPMTGVEPRLLSRRLFDSGRKTLLASDPEGEDGKEPCSPPGNGASSGNPKSAPADRPPRRPGVLGLLLHDGQYKVGREGYKDAVQLTKLQWELLAKLIHDFGALANFKMLCSVWEGRAGNAETPSPGTVRDAISALRKKLQILGVAIRSKKKLGWELVELDARAISEERNLTPPGA